MTFGKHAKYTVGPSQIDLWNPLGLSSVLFFFALFSDFDDLKNTQNTLYVCQNHDGGGPPRQEKHKKTCFSTFPRNAPESLGPLKVSIIDDRSSQNRRFCRIGSPRGLGGPLWLFGGLGALRKGSFLKDLSCILRVLKMPLRRFTDGIVKNTCVFNDFKRPTSKTHSVFSDFRKRALPASFENH